MTVFVNKKNISHIYDILNKYFKDGYYDIYSYIKNRHEIKKSLPIKVVSTTLDSKLSNVCINLGNSDINIKMNISYGTRIKLKGTMLIVDLPFIDNSAYGSGIKFIKLSDDIIEKRNQEEHDFNQLLNDIMSISFIGHHINYWS